MQVSKSFVAVAVAALVGGATLAADVAPAQAQSGPSFNCKRARTFIEKEICRSASLSAKDRRMSQLYFRQLKAHQTYGDGLDVNEFKAEQRSWLARRDRCQTAACLHEAYDYRLAELENY